MVRLDVWQGHIAKVGQLRVNGHGIDKAGRLRLAHGGTLFLEEVADLPLDYQGRLRAALRDQQVTRVGEDRQRGFNVRLNASTSCDLSREVETRDGTGADPVVRGHVADRRAGGVAAHLGETRAEDPD
ncbi:sigma 54-interacting transcriptional regulator [Pseudooceanicola marinus]|uniref:sigma 54-interacting transcriptional regulator n=1 Tax=Pseudooceanicola marinus TaxID=396013 RepID=UPI0012FE0778|nr:sigma 54-interacting transcriptional regulator [Pseudooceanicola marinus]